MTGWLPDDPERIFGDGATATEAYELLTVDVPAERWTAAVTAARDDLGCTFFDWLSAVDEPETGFRVCVHLVALPSAGTAGAGTGAAAGAGTAAGAAAAPRRLLLRTTVPHDAPAVASITGLFAGAGWHERETHEMFGIDFPGHPGLTRLLLPEGFEGHPLRKDFVLAARVVKAWPGAKEPGESDHGGPKRRQMQPPGVPDPNEWGPLKGQLPPAPARRGAAGRKAAPARRARPADGEAAPRPPRRARSASEGSASRRGGPPADAPAGPGAADQGGDTGKAGETRKSGETGRAGEAGKPDDGGRAGEAGSGGGEIGRRSTDAPWRASGPAAADGADEPGREGDG